MVSARVPAPPKQVNEGFMRDAMARFREAIFESSEEDDDDDGDDAWDDQSPSQPYRSHKQSIHASMKTPSARYIDSSVWQSAVESQANARQRATCGKNAMTEKRRISRCALSEGYLLIESYFAGSGK